MSIHYRTHRYRETAKNDVNAYHLLAKLISYKEKISALHNSKTHTKLGLHFAPVPV